jgi:hypothetical protein
MLHLCRPGQRGDRGAEGDELDALSFSLCVIVAAIVD